VPGFFFTLGFTVKLVLAVGNKKVGPTCPRRKKQCVSWRHSSIMLSFRA